MSSTAPGAAHPRAAEDLGRRYAAYRRTQTTRLVQLMPREAIRPLYRRACATAAPGEDVLEVLLNYCEVLLPLPPFSIWKADLLANPEAHLEDLDQSVDAPTSDMPSTVGVREVLHSGRRWIARLESYRAGGAWRAYIAFEDEEAGRVHRTAPVFREHDPASLRERFMSFEAVALEAFLRSALP